jgi:hypothetical protein
MQTRLNMETFLFLLTSQDKDTDKEEDITGTGYTQLADI